MNDASSTAGDSADASKGASTGASRQVWAMLLVLCAGFALSQAFRTVAAMMAKPLEAHFALSATQLGVFAALFHFTFGAMQLFMGTGIDLFGVRRTILVAFPVAALGAFLTAFAPVFPLVLVGQALIGIGCAPAFLVCTVFIAQRFPPERFAATSGLCMSIGGIGMLITGTPLAWLVETYSWRAGFIALAVASVFAWLAILLFANAEATPPRSNGESMPAALARFGRLFLEPHSAGILILAAVTYAAFITLRGLWLGPLLIERHGFTLIESGNVALAVSVLAMIGAPVLGSIRARGMARRRWILRFTLLQAALFVLLACRLAAWVDVAASLASAFVCGFVVLQYADTRASYPENITGRAIAIFTMAMFLGVALMQWFTGLVAEIAKAHGVESFAAVNASIALLLVLGATAFRYLPSQVADR